MSEQPVTPETERLVAVADDSHKIGEFLDWLDSKQILLCTVDRERFRPIQTSKGKILALYFNIDLKKVEDERAEILRWLREQQGAPHV